LRADETVDGTADLGHADAQPDGETHLLILEPLGHDWVLGGVKRLWAHAEDDPSDNEEPELRVKSTEIAD
jgi:hypothetical protein